MLDGLVKSLLKRLPKSRRCGAFVDNQERHCTHKSIPGTKYCLKHESRLVAVVSLIVAVLSPLATALYRHYHPSEELVELRGTKQETIDARQEAKETRKEFSEKLTTLNVDLKTAHEIIKDLRKIEVEYRQFHAKVVDVLATNRNITAEGRAKIISLDSEFQSIVAMFSNVQTSWLDNLRYKWEDKLAKEKIDIEIQNEKAFEQKANIYATRAPAYAFALNTITNLLIEAARLHGNTVQIQYVGVPQSIIYGIDSTNVAKLTFQPDSKWNMSADVQTFFPDPALRIDSDFGWYFLLNSAGRGQFHYPGRDEQFIKFGITNYESVIAEELKSLIGYQEYMFQKQSK